MHQCSLSELAKVQGLGDGFKVFEDFGVPCHGIEGFKVHTIFQLPWLWSCRHQYPETSCGRVL
jgi:hypothetical protein